MFEAIHGSAPDIAGQQIANPSGLLNAAVMMLSHLGQTEVANTIKNAWLYTIEQGYHTADIYQEDGNSIVKVSTSEFADAVIANLGRMPNLLPTSKIAADSGKIEIPAYERKTETQTLVGVDVFVNWPGSDANVIGNRLLDVKGLNLKLKMITNRGVKVFPNGLKETYCTDHWRCRFVATNVETGVASPVYQEIKYQDVLDLLTELNSREIMVIKTENLYEFDGRRAFSLGQGE
jgi:isocitrate dehydrogenase